MTENDLEEYKAIKLEIEDLNKRIATEKNAPIADFGTVKGSNRYYPYTECTFNVAGIDPADAKQRQIKIDMLIREKEFQFNELIRKKIEIENFISSIDNSVLRTIFRMYYIDGLTQFQISKKLGYDQASVSRKINSFFKKLHIMHK